MQSIGDNVFAGLTELREFNIPKSVTSIASNAFIGCKKLQKMTFDPDAEIQLIGAGAFSREVLWLIEEINNTKNEWEILGFLDDNLANKGKIIQPRQNS